MEVRQQRGERQWARYYQWESMYLGAIHPVSYTLPMFISLLVLN